MSPKFNWQKLPAIPDEEGFASPFAGISNNALLVAGGANIVGDRWKDPLNKKWYDSVFVLDRPDGKWVMADRLPQPRAYGVSITIPDGVVCIGGSDEARHFSDVFLLKWDGRALKSLPLPALPQPCANACGALVGSTIYVAGGLRSPGDTEAMHTFWSLDLGAPGSDWHELEPWPGPPCMFSVAAVQDGSFFLFSGTSLSVDANGKTQRTYLKNAYRFTPGSGWKRLADLPRPANAAPSPAFVCGKNTISIVSGSDGAPFAEPPVHHPGFPRNLLVYETARDAWSTISDSPVSLATVPVVDWNGRFIIPGGESRPRVRTTEVWSVSCGE